MSRLYTPQVSPSAIPPRNYPPSFHLLSFVTSSSLFLFLLLLLLPRVPSWTSSVFAITSGYAFVSAVTLGRPSWWMSRYETSSQLLLAMSSAPLLELLQPGWAALPEMLIGFVLGLQFTWLDAVPSLQRLGCKVVLPSAWGWGRLEEGQERLSSREMQGIGLLALGLGLGLVVGLKEVGWMVGVGYGVGLGVWGMLVKEMERKGWTVHLHHYVMGLVMVPMTMAVQEESPKIGRFLQGCGYGVFVEGIAVWGMDPVFIRPQQH